MDDKSERRCRADLLTAAVLTAATLALLGPNARTMRRKQARDEARLQGQPESRQPAEAGHQKGPETQTAVEDPSQALRDLLVEYMKEQYTQVRQHDTLRTNATTFLTAAAGVILGFQFKDGSTQPNLLIGILLFLVGFANYRINEGHFFGNRYHNNVIGEARRALENLILRQEVHPEDYELYRISTVRTEAIKNYIRSGEFFPKECVPKEYVWFAPLLMRSKKPGKDMRKTSKGTYDTVGGRVHDSIQSVPVGVMLVGIALSTWALVALAVG